VACSTVVFSITHSVYTLSADVPCVFAVVTYQSTAHWRRSCFSKVPSTTTPTTEGNCRACKRPYV